MRYQPHVLRGMAETFLREQERGNVLCQILLMRLILATGKSREDCERGIKLLADRGFA